MHYLLSKLKLNSNKHVVFADGTIGAHIIDYLRYVIHPAMSRVPLGTDKFMTLLKNAGVPESVYSAPRPTAWLTF